jgi:3-oxoacyl-[acyl-carrier protein] reductase
MTASHPTTEPSDRRIAVVGDARHYVGPDLARMLAVSDHDLVLGDPSDELLAELEARGASVVAVEGGSRLHRAEASASLATAAMERFGRIDAAVTASGRIMGGRFVDSTLEQFDDLVTGCLYAPFHFLQAMVPVMVERGSGQILIITSASGARPVYGASLYSATRAGANMLVRAVAEEVARKGVQINAVGTNYMDFPEFLAATGATDPAVRAEVEAQVPMRRLGRMDEFAEFCRVFLDGRSTFTTGQYVSYAGGWA